MIADYMDRGPAVPEEAGGGMRPTYDMWGTVLPASDRTGKGSVRVRVKTMKDNMDTFDDVPVLTGYGGDGYGLLFLPEEGDIVRLTFLGGDFCHPVVTGCRFPFSSRFVGDNCQEKNLKKVWKVKNGSMIAFDGDKGEERIEISGPEKMKWELKEKEEQIAFGDRQGENRMLLDGGEGRVEIAAGESILLKCGKSSLELKKDGSVSLRCERLSLEAKNVEVKGKTKVKVEGQEVAVEGSTGVSVGGRGQVKIESKGPLKLSGAMIHLN